MDDTTYFGIELNLSANSPSRDGQASAKPWYVTRPSSSASVSIVSSSLNLSPASPRSNSKLQPPYLKPSAPPGSSMTPSSEMNSVTMIRAMPSSFAMAGRTGGADGTQRCARISRTAVGSRSAQRLAILRRRLVDDQPCRGRPGRGLAILAEHGVEGAARAVAGGCRHRPAPDLRAPTQSSAMNVASKSFELPVMRNGHRTVAPGVGDSTRMRGVTDS